MTDPKEAKKKAKERMEGVIKGLDLGNGISVSMGYGDNIDYFYTNKMEAPTGLAHDLKIEVSSSQEDDAELLHHLLEKTRNSKI